MTDKSKPCSQKYLAWLKNTLSRFRQFKGFSIYSGFIIGIVAGILPFLQWFPLKGPFFAVQEILLSLVFLKYGNSAAVFWDQVLPMVIMSGFSFIPVALVNGLSIGLIMALFHKPEKIHRAKIILLVLLFFEVLLFYTMIWASSVAFDTIRITPYNYKTFLFLLLCPMIISLLLLVFLCILSILSKKIFKKYRFQGIRFRYKAAFVILFLLSFSGYYKIFTAQRAAQTDIPRVKNPSASKVLLVGVDGMEWDLIREFSAKGTIPEIKKIVKNGTRAYFRTDFPYLSPVVWTSIATGKKKAVHGIMGFFNEQSSEVHVNTGLDVKTLRIWDILSNYGIKTGVSNWFYTWPAYNIDGFMISDLLPYSGLNKRAFPEEISQNQEDPSKFAVLPSPEQVINFNFDENYQKYAINSPEFQKNAIYSRLKNDFLRDSGAFKKTLSIIEEQGPPDFLAIYFKGTDSFSHSLWKYYLAEKKPDFVKKFFKVSEEDIRNFSHGIENYYGFVDTCIRELLKQYDSTPTIILASDHGFGFRTTGLRDFDFNLLFEKLGMLKFKDSSGEIDWEHTKVFDNKKTVGFQNYIRNLSVNLKGRNSDGIVESGGEYKQLQDNLYHILSTLETTEGHKLFDNVKKLDGQDGADLQAVVKLHLIREHIRVSGSVIPLSSLFTSLDISGMHRYDGVLVLSGDKINEDKTLVRACSRDLAPTILHLFGLPVPLDMCGAVLTDALVHTFMNSHPVTYIDTYESRIQLPAKGSQIGSEVTQKIEEELKILGYMR